MSTFMDKLGVIWKGPSWFPGIPRLGLDKYKINVSFIFHTLLLLLLHTLLLLDSTHKCICKKYYLLLYTTLFSDYQQYFMNNSTDRKRIRLYESTCMKVK